MRLDNRGAMIGMAVMLVLILTSCSLSGRSPQKAEQQARNDAEVTAIHDMLTKTPGVAKVSVGYSDYITAPGSAHVNLTVTGGTDLEHAADLAIEAVWHSQLDPLKSIRVGVVDDNASTGIERGYNVFDGKAELEAKYGPRPAGPVTRGTGRG